LQQGRNICPMLGVNTQRRFGADHWTGQASNGRSTPSYVERWLQGEKPQGESPQG